MTTIQNIRDAIDAAHGTKKILERVQACILSDGPTGWDDEEMAIIKMAEAGIDTAIGKLECYCIHTLDVVAAKLEKGGAG